MNIAHYLLQVNLYLVAFYALYILLLAKETYFVINRIYLIGAGILSLVIPYIRLDWFAKPEVHEQFYVSVDQMLSQAVVITEVEKHFNWGLLFVAVYVFGVLFFTAKLIFKLLHLKKLFKAGSSGQAFSFLNKKVVSGSLPQQETINHHENIHIKQLHTLDVLFFELLGIINWFNPVSYLFKKAVKNIHEYLADEETARLQSDKETYALLLLSHALKVSPNTLTNSFFNKSMLKKRIYMLHKQRSQKVAILKYGLFVPLFGLALILSSSTINKNQEILSISNQIPLSNLADVKSALTAPVVVAKSITESQNQEPKNQKNMKNTLKTAVLALAGLTAQHVLVQANDIIDTSTMGVVKTTTAQSTPIYIVDGLQVTKMDLEKLAPTDIDLVSVLKGKSAVELYGAKGNGGVMLIITKSGAPGNAEAKKIAKSFQYKNIIMTQENYEKYKNALVIIDGVEQTGKGMGTVRTFLISHKLNIVSNKLLHGKEATQLYGGNGEDGVVIITTENNTSKKEARRYSLVENPPIYIVDGVETLRADFAKIKPLDIEMMIGLKGKAAIDFYGDKGKDGVMLIITKSGAPGNAKAKEVAIYYSENRYIPKTNDESIYDFVSIDKAPQFPGGIKAFYEYVGKELKYPEVAVKNNIQGKVFFEFIVEKNGELTDIKIMRGLSPECDKEGMRLISNSVKWNPGNVRGVPVRVIYRININFTLGK